MDIDIDIHEKVSARANQDKLYALCKKSAPIMTDRLWLELTEAQKKQLEDLLLTISIMNAEQVTCAYLLGLEHGAAGK